jgi:ABC-type sugar transport system ATPase subunit
MISGRQVAIRCHGLAKNFGAIQALHPTDFEVKVGTIHALVGQNGAGKSTMLGIIAGRIPPSAGTVEVFGETASLGDPRSARAAGIVGIYQELTVIPAMSAVDNVFLGQMPSTRGMLARKPMRRQFDAMARRLGVTIQPDAESRALSVADQQILEIMRALQSEARIILFDEPTASLANPERRALFRLMRDLRDREHSMVFVSHNLDEVIEIADEITVFRNGRLVATRPTKEWVKSSIVAAMLGEDMGDVYRRRAGTGDRSKPLLMRAHNVTVPGALHCVSIDLRQGEVLGIAGMVGSGRTSLLRALAGLEPGSSGSLEMHGKTVLWPHAPRAARRAGIALVPEDRKTQGLVLKMSAMENVALGDLGRGTFRGLFSRSTLRTAMMKIARRFRFDTARLGHDVSDLSGGNQQKALLARWWFSRPDVLLVDEPTRGIDIGAKGEILDALRDFASEGTGVVIVSSEFEELVSLADRVVVLAEGRQVKELDAASSPLNMEAILNAAFEVDLA